MGKSSGMRQVGVLAGPIVAAALLAGGCSSSPVDSVGRSTASSSTLPTAPAPSTGTPSTGTGQEASVGARLDEAMQTHDGFAGAVLVAREDEVLLSKGYGLSDAARGKANGPTTRFRIGSITKQFTAAAILLLQERGRLKVTDHLCEYLPRCPAAWKPITLHHLLTHTAGLPEVTDLPQFEAASQRPTTPDQQLGWVRGEPLEFAPGSNFHYSNTGYLALGRVIEKVTGQSYETFVNTAIFEPLGMRDSGYDTGDDDVAVGYSTGTTVAAPINMVVPHAAGALYSTAQDLLVWEHALLGGDLLRPASLTAMTTSAVDLTDKLGFGYGYGIYVSLEPSKPVLGHDGGINGFRSLLVHNRSTGITIIVWTNHEEDAPNLDDVAETLTLAVDG